MDPITILSFIATTMKFIQWVEEVTHDGKDFTEVGQIDMLEARKQMRDMKKALKEVMKNNPDIVKDLPTVDKKED